jgi:hypothetical protein
MVAERVLSKRMDVTEHLLRTEATLGRARTHRRRRP